MALGCGDVLIFLAVLLFIVYWYGKRKYDHFKGTGVKFTVPAVPYFGSTLPIFMRFEHFKDFLQRNYYLHSDKYSGLFEGPRPLIFIRDLNLIKQIGIKEFDRFPKHRNVIDEDIDELFGNSLFSLTGDKWRDMRSTLSPAFTSAKMKNMFIFIEECAKDVAKSYLDECAQLGKNTIEIEAKDAFSRYTNDVIANSAFGVRVNSIKDKENEFFNITKTATRFSGVQILKFSLYAFFPTLMKMLKVEFISARAKQFYRSVVSDTMRTREENSIIRNDMINLLMEAKKGNLKHERHIIENSDAGFATVQESSSGKHDVHRKWTDDELVAQVLIFLIGGFDTSSNMIIFFFYEMVRNPEIQKTLQQEIDDYIAEHGETVAYGDLQKLMYLDGCISETLRMWPPALATDRVCTKAYTLPLPSDSSTKPYTIQPDNAVWIPIYSLHHDPKYFPDPHKFDPERFSGENKSNINMDAYMPFGIGPRNCIGSRFALMVGKLIAFHILAKFDVVATDKTENPLQLDNSSFNFLAKNGIHLGLKKRS